VGDVQGEANCILRLGNIALRRSDHAGARQRYEEALPLYRQVGAVLGEANCIQSLGDIALRDGRAEEARERFQTALDLYGRIPEPYSIGWALCRLARIEKDKSKRADLLAQIASVWMGIDREDLVEGLRREFPGEA
jgi:tetratricopeptide (TPR) repeat protein